jgi:hypothetical protein
MTPEELAKEFEVGHEWNCSSDGCEVNIAFLAGYKAASKEMERLREALKQYAKGKWYPVKIDNGVTRWTLDVKDPHLIAENALGVFRG